MMNTGVNEIQVLKGNPSLGLQAGDPKEGKKPFPFVKQLKADSLAKDLLEPDDYIVSVNGVNMEGKPYSAVHAEVRKTGVGEKVTFMIRQPTYKELELSQYEEPKRLPEPLPEATEPQAQMGEDYANPADYRAVEPDAEVLYEEPTNPDEDSADVSKDEVTSAVQAIEDAANTGTETETDGATTTDKEDEEVEDDNATQFNDADKMTEFDDEPVMEEELDAEGNPVVQPKLGDAGYVVVDEVGVPDETKEFAEAHGSSLLSDSTRS
eukprot:m.259068 g.259068  ORF g.259068 m.259068 type:complete len:266 (+) comp37544_c0_seq1:126-923(+)